MIIRSNRCLYRQVVDMVDTARATKTQVVEIIFSFCVGSSDYLTNEPISS